MENVALKVLVEKLVTLAAMENGVQLEEGMFELVVFNLEMEFGLHIDAPATGENVLAVVQAVDAWVADTLANGF